MYTVERSSALRVADLVAVARTEPLAKFLADRAYLPRGASPAQPTFERCAIAMARRLPRSVKRGPCSLLRTLGDRSGAADRGAGLRRDAHPDDRRSESRKRTLAAVRSPRLAPLYAVCSARERCSGRCR